MARDFLEQFAQESHQPVRTLSAEALEKLCCHDWPGNVRELRSVLGCVAADSRQTQINADEIDLELAVLAKVGGPIKPMRTALAEFKRSRVNGYMSAARGNVSEAARLAGMDRSAFWRLTRPEPESSPTPGIAE